MSHLELRFLGPPLIRLDESPVRLERRKAVALLAFLAVKGGVHRRDSLVNLLWPEFSQSRGRAALRQVLHLVNTLPSMSRCLDVGPETVEMRDDEDLWIDVRRFHTYLAECRKHHPESLEACPVCCERLRTALELYTDDFLAGFTLKDSVNFDDWQLEQSENFRAELHFLLNVLVNSSCARGRYLQAIEYGRRWVALDRLNEAAHRWLMQLYVWQGQRPAALRQYEECSNILKREFDASPEKETTELFEAVKADQASQSELPGDGLQFVGSPVARTRVNAQVKLPTRATALIGRREEVARIGDLLVENRLLTLIGPGGCGKTHLAIEAAADKSDRFPGGICFVPLETVRNPSKVPQAIASTLEIPEVPGESLEETICRVLADRAMLVVLDNFEQVLPASVFVNRLLAEAPALRVVVTSREPLGVGGEQEVPVHPLAQADASVLFQKRAQAVKPDFGLTAENAGSVAEICSRLDGLPLAIELAAARIKLLPPDELLSRLNHWLTVGSRRHDVPERHRTMQNTVRWSYDLLGDDERQLFARLAVFSGGFTLDAAEQVCGTEPGSDPQAVIESLLNKSLVQAADDGAAARFTQLETIREFAAECLQADPLCTSIRNDHARFFCEVAQRLGSDFHEGRSYQLESPDTELFRQLDTEYENVRTAMEWSASGGDPEVGHRIVGALRWYWERRSLFTEGLEWTKRFLGLGGTADEGVLSRTYLSGQLMLQFLGDENSSREMCLEAEHHAKAAGDRVAEAYALVRICVLDMPHPEHHDNIEQRLHRAMELFRAVDLPHGVSSASNAMGMLLAGRGEYEPALAAYRECIRFFEDSRVQPHPAIFENIGVCHRHLENPSDAQDAFRRALRLALEQQLGDHQVAFAIELLAPYAETPEQAVRLIGAADSLRNAVGAAVEAVDETEHDEIIAAVRSRLSQSDFDHHFSAGQSLSIEEAVRAALAV